MASKREREKIKESQLDEIYEMVVEILELLRGTDGAKTKDKTATKNTRNGEK